MIKVDLGDWIIEKLGYELTNTILKHKTCKLWAMVYPRDNNYKTCKECSATIPNDVHIAAMLISEIK